MQRFTRRRRLLHTALGACVVLSIPFIAHAADKWPSKPVKVLVPFAAGGNSDIAARLLTPGLSEILGQPFVVENKPGASGNIATEAAARSTPDGYTLLLGTVGTQAINPSVYKNIPYDTLKDFSPVTLIASVPNVLVVNPSNKAKTVAELVEQGKGRPVTFASSGAGSSIHLSGELFKSMTQLDMTHIPYRGSAPAVTDLIGGQVEMIFDNLPTSLPFIQSGNLRPLAVTTATRVAQLPDVPTMIESGFPGFELGSWFGILAPAGTPDDIVSRLDDAILQIVNQPEFEQKLIELGAQRTVKSKDEFQAFIESEYKKWGDVVKASGASVQ